MHHGELLGQQGQEQILKVLQGSGGDDIQRSKNQLIRLIADFSSATLNSRRQWENIFKGVSNRELVGIYIQSNYHSWERLRCRQIQPCKQNMNS